jgi:predicted RNase H-like HicB family nuclease
MIFPLTAYLEAAMELAHYDKLEDGSFAGEIPKLPGVIAFGGSLKECERELRSTLEDWVLVGLRLGHRWTHTRKSEATDFTDNHG